MPRRQKEHLRKPRTHVRTKLAGMDMILHPAGKIMIIIKTPTAKCTSTGSFGKRKSYRQEDAKSIPRREVHQALERSNRGGDIL